MILLSLAILAVQAVSAQERPSDADLFGGGSDTAAPAATSVPTAQPGLLADALQIGGQYYLRSFVSANDEQKPRDWAMSSPHLLDLYFDARPNDRVRGMLRLRVSESTTTNPLLKSLQDQFGIDLSGGGVNIGLDQFWINYDWGRKVFVTAGRQHVKWGTGRFWNPTDYLHPQARDPLAQFDDRLGVNLVKFHIPWEKKGWNFYPVVLLETNPNSDNMKEIGGAFRSETLIGPAELGLDVVAYNGYTQGSPEQFATHGWPRFGADISFPLGPFDIHAESAWSAKPEVPLYRPDNAGNWSAYQGDQVSYSIVGGISYDWKYSDQDSLSLGVEGFYNRDGYHDLNSYDDLAAAGAFRPFYLGERYLSAVIFMPNPGSWNHSTFVLSGLTNLSDQSALTRLDINQQVLTHLHVEMYLSGHYGRKGGEFRRGYDIPEQNYGGGFVIPAIHSPVPVVEAGMALRINV